MDFNASAQGSGFSVSAQGWVELPSGSQVDVTTASGMEAARGEMAPGQLAELQDIMRQLGFALEAGKYIPHDEYADVQANHSGGPTSSGAQSESDLELISSVFEKNGIVNPYNSNTTESWGTKLADNPNYQSALQSMNAAVEDPTAGNINQAAEGVVGLADSEGANIYELLFLVFRESIRETNEDRRYFLEKMQDYNAIAEGITGYLSDLVQVSKDLDEKCKDKEYPSKESIPVEMKTFDTSTVGADGKALELPMDKPKQELRRASLGDELKRVESMQETVRNNRQMASTSFQNFDQKANQLYNLMTSVLKSVNEMRQGTVRNML